MPSFTQRSRKLERIDFPQPQHLWDDALVFIRRVNRFLGGTRAVLWHFRRWSRSWKPGERIVVLDVGTGGGDIPHALAKWGRSAGFDLRIVALDRAAECVRAAKLGTGGVVDIVRGDAFRMPVREVDYVTASMLFHHLGDEDCLRLLRIFGSLARRGIVVNDLLRRRRAWLWARALSSVYGELAANDAPLSVLRGFSLPEAQSLADASGLTWLRLDEFFGHRFTLAGERP
ncbi:MAG: methyltransferase domain-containing protein [Planctomycetota bacterium]